MIDDWLSREKLEREVVEFRVLVESKSMREEMLERELEMLRRSVVNLGVVGYCGSVVIMIVGSGNDRNFYWDFCGIVVLVF